MFSKIVADLICLNQCYNEEYIFIRLFVCLFVIYLGEDFESSLLSFEKLDRASPDLWPEQCKFEGLILLILTKIIFY